MVGEYSEDGKWVWNGHEWKPVESLTPPQIIIENPPPEELSLPNHENNVTIELSEGNPKMRVFAGALGILLAIILLGGTYFAAIETGNMIDDVRTEFNDGVYETNEEEEVAKDLEKIKMLWNVVMFLSAITIILSVLMIMNKIPWWTLPTTLVGTLILFFVIGMLSANAANAYYDTCDPEEYSNCGDFPEEVIWDQDGAMCGYCNAIGLFCIGLVSLASTGNPKDEEEGGISAKNKFFIVIAVLVALFLIYIIFTVILVMTGGGEPSCPSGQVWVEGDGECMGV